MPRQQSQSLASSSGLRGAANALRSAIKEKLPDALEKIANATAMAFESTQGAIEGLEERLRQLGEPNVFDPIRRTPMVVSGDRIRDGVSVQGGLGTVRGQSLDLTLEAQVGKIAATDHSTGGSLELDINGSTVKITGAAVQLNGHVAVGTEIPSSNGNVGGQFSIDSGPGNKNAVLVLGTSAATGTGNGGIFEVKSDLAVTGDPRFGQISFGRVGDFTAGKITSSIAIYLNFDGTLLSMMSGSFTGSGAMLVQIEGILVLSRGAIAAAPIRLKGYTVATLPAAFAGDTAFVTDALSPTYLGIVVGGGAVRVPVFFNGTNWVVG